MTSGIQSKQFPIAAESSGRAWVGIESNAEYLAIAQNRIASVVAEQGFL